MSATTRGELRRRLDDEARSVLDEVGAVRLSIAREVIGVSDTTVREWIRDGVLEATVGRPARVTLTSAVEARDLLATRRAAPDARRGDDDRRQAGTAHDGFREALPAAEWIRRGLLHGEVLEDGAVDLSERECLYFQSHGEVLERLVDAANETESVPLIVLFGSVARGDDTAQSDVDLLVRSSEDSVVVVSACESALGRTVETVTLDVLEEQPALAAAIWRRVEPFATAACGEGLRAQRRQFEVAADRNHEQIRTRARAALDEMKAAT